MEVIEIKSGWNEALLYSGEHTDVKEAAEAAVNGGADLSDADLSDANLSDADLSDADLVGAKVGAGDDGARLAGSRPIVQIGPIGPRNDWLLVFWCGDSGMRISTGYQNQITEHRFLERLAEAHGAGDDADIHVENYLAALAFAKRMTESHTF